jgi:3-oxoacyl-[acyl-carrier-protein] synthase-3
MYMYTQGHSRLISTGVHLPEKRVSSREILQEIDSLNRFGVSHDWLDKAMGIHERRVAEAGVLPSDMATHAALEAMKHAGVVPADIDAIIYAGVIRDYLEPATAHIVQHKIDARNAVAFDVTNACHGFMNGIHLMDALIATGQVRRGLVVTGEQGFRYTEKAMQALRHTDDRTTFTKLVGGLTLGDAGAAILLGPKLGPDSGFMGFMLQSQGEHSALCVCGHEGEGAVLETDMASIVAKGIAMLGDMYDEFMGKLKWSPVDIDKFVHHQVGLKVFAHHAHYAKISLEIMPNTLTTMGNLITASIPVNLHKLRINNEIQRGQKVFIAGAGSGLSVSQAGLIWDAA